MTTKRQWVDEAKKFVSETRGVAELYVVRTDQMLESILSGSIVKDHKAQRFMELIGKYLIACENPKNWPSGRPLCMTCDTEFGPGHHVPRAVLIQVPFAKRWEVDASQAVVSGLCAKCAQKSDSDICTIAAAIWGGHLAEAPGPQ